jgi:RNA polymerase sigma factor (sigma-70 family)
LGWGGKRVEAPRRTGEVKPMLDVSADQGTFTRSIRLLIADRQPIVLQGLKSVFAAQRDFEIVASCSTGTSCIEAIRNLTPDVALLADGLLDLTASEILAIAQAERLPTRLVFFTESETDDLTAAVAAGACSAISKYAPPDTMLRTLRLMTEDISASPQDRSLNGKAIDAAKIDKMLGLLTQRESQIVQLVSEGLSNKEIARQLDVSQGTVKVHLHNIFQKLEISNRTVLATIALLQRPAGFGTLTLVAFAFAVLDDVKASETNATFMDGDSAADRDPEHPAFDIWKKAILRHTVAVDSGETVQRGLSFKVSQVTNPAARMEGLHAAEQTVLSNTGRGYGPIGSSTPSLFVSPLLQAINNSQAGSPVQPQLPLLESVSNPVRSPGGYGVSTLAAAGAWITTLDNANAAAQVPNPGEMLIDTAKVAAMDAATHVATITIHGDALRGAGSADVVYGGSGNDTIGGNGGADTVNGNDGKDTTSGGHGGGQPAGSNGDDILVRGSAKDSRATQPDTIVDSDKINLAALGALAFLHLTSTSTSVPPHTLAWIYNATSNETIVYVNPTDSSLDIGDPGLLEIHLQGAVNVAEADFVYEPDAAAVAAALEGVDPTLLDVTASDGILLTAETAYASIEPEATEHAHATAGIWTMPADDGFKFHFARDRINSSVSTTGVASAAEKPAYAAEESGSGAVVVPAHVSSIELAHSPATVLTDENPAFKNETAHANTSAATNGHGAAHANTGLQPFEPGTQGAAIVTPSPLAEPSAPGNSGGHSNSQHASNNATANATEAPEPIEASAAPGNSGGHGNPQHASNPVAANASSAAEPTEPGVAHGNNSSPPSHAASANAAQALEPTAISVAPGNSAGHGNPQHASNGPAANASSAAEPTEPGIAPSQSHSPPSHAASANAAEAPGPIAISVAPGNSAGHRNVQHAPQTAATNSPAVAEPTEPNITPGHSNPEPASQPASASSVAAAEPIEASVAAGNGGGHGNSQHASLSATPNAPAAANPAEPSVKPGHSNPEPASPPAKVSSVAAAEPIETGVAQGNGGGHGNSQHASQSVANASAGAQSAEPASAASASHEPAFHFNNQAVASTPTETVGLEELNGSPVLPSAGAELAAILRVGPPAVEEDAAGHGNSGPHHAAGHSSHELLT